LPENKEKRVQSELQISFFNCCGETRERTITVKKHGEAPWRFVARAARHFTRWITVTAGKIVCDPLRRVCRALRYSFRGVGVQILRQSAILRV